MTYIDGSDVGDLAGMAHSDHELLPARIDKRTQNRTERFAGNSSEELESFNVSDGLV
jgi:hypothetical protein